MSDFIIIILAVAVSIISSVVKANKKKKNRQQPKKPILDDDPWASIRRFMDPESEDDDRDILSEYGDVKAGDSRDEEHGDEVRIIREIQENRKRSLIEREKAVTDNLKDIPKDTSVIVAEDALGESSDNHFLEDFDLRSAVIYSEILKPKFED